MKKLVFYRCKHCGNISVKLVDKRVPMMCCGERMKELDPLTRDGAVEKHVPVYEVEGNVVNVKVGSVEHPMVAEHYIQWIVLQTNQGAQIKYLEPEHPPVASFALAEGEVVEAVLEYCNLHGLWQA
jgi:superoxide reductase